MARCLAGLARRDVTPPLGIYSRSWGAALHDMASGVHRPFTATALALQAVEDAASSPQALLALDLGWLEPAENEEFLKRLRHATGLTGPRLLVCLSHTHSGPNLTLKLSDRPGGHLLRPYFDQLVQSSIDALREACASLRPAWLTLAAGQCNLAVNRDAWDEDSQQYVCGYNPEVAADDTLWAGLVTADWAGPIATILNYGCHPTTLGPENKVLSPDYIGSARQVLESHFRIPCLFLLGACGDTAPREGYAGDPRVADRNGRQLGHAALSALESLLPPGMELAYTGPMISGATLGTWAQRRVGGEALAEAEMVRNASIPLRIPLKPKESLEALQTRYDQSERALQSAMASGDVKSIRNATAMHERARRLLHRAPLMPPGDSIAIDCCAWQIGSTFLLTVPAEPYSWLQVELRRRFPGRAILVSAVTNGTIAYLMPRDRYGIGLYQDWMSPAGPGGLEMILDAAAAQIGRWTGESQA
ncbi:MAG: neutral/alkaline non-lysosomal ceramidase N-terminal domain-containing protein [Planctomycetes bacterium]|nr:neutral/alkaline non-lysosomal ceramidase N-terminal domain-containing protein [Planctomycetota bacterium]